MVYKGEIKMKENLQNTVNEALKGIIETASQIKQFSLEQIPDVLNQLLIFKFAEAIVVIVFCTIFITLSYIWFTILVSQEKEYGMWSDSKVIASIVGGFVSALSIVCIMLSIIDILKITLAPKLYLIEYAAHLIK